MPRGNAKKRRAGKVALLKPVMVEHVTQPEEDSLKHVSHLYDALRRANLERPGRILFRRGSLAPPLDQNEYFSESCTLRPGPAPGTCPNAELGRGADGLSK